MEVGFTFDELEVITSDRVRNHFDAIFQEYKSAGLKDVKITLQIVRPENDRGIKETYKMDKDGNIETVKGKRIERKVWRKSA